MLLPRSLDLTCQSSKSGNGKKRISNNCRMLLLSSVPIKVVKACGIRSFKFTIYEERYDYNSNIRTYYGLCWMKLQVTDLAVIM